MKTVVVVVRQRLQITMAMVFLKLVFHLATSTLSMKPMAP